MSYLRELAISYAEKEQFSAASLLFVKALKNGDYNTINDLGVMNESIGKYDNARELYEKATEYGCDFAYINLGNIYERGFGVEQDFEKAFHFYKKAQSKNIKEAYNRLGNLYFNGLYVEKDPKLAFKYYKIASKYKESNNEDTNNVLGYFYSAGIGVKKNNRKAFKYFSKAVKQNSLEGRIFLSNCYLEGLGVKKDVSKCLKYLYEAAKYNYPEALFNLAYFYEGGVHTEKDLELANLFLNQAEEVDYFEVPLLKSKMIKLGELENISTNEQVAFNILREYVLRIDNEKELFAYKVFKRDNPTLFDYKKIEEGTLVFGKDN